MLPQRTLKSQHLLFQLYHLHIDREGVKKAMRKKQEEESMVGGPRQGRESGSSKCCRLGQEQSLATRQQVPFLAGQLLQVTLDDAVM